MIRCAWTMLLAACCITGCGTTRWSDTRRTATEQLLVSDAVDRAVQKIDFRVLDGKVVYLETDYLSEAVDQEYLISSLRQHLLASGCVLMDEREDAGFIVEARAGAIGTDRHDLLYGLPATNLPSFMPIPSMPSSLPEIPLVKRTDQLGVAKISVFAYNRETGERLWQSGIVSHSSRAKDIWVFGAGPYQKGTIRDGTMFAGQKIRNPLVRRTPRVKDTHPGVDLTAELYFERPHPLSPGRPTPTTPFPEPPAIALGPPPNE